MKQRQRLSHGRRRLLHGIGVLPFAYLLSTWPDRNDARAGEVLPTPACTDADEPTSKQMEGPFFKPHSPERASLLELGLAGAKLLLSGFVLSTTCEPIAGALLEFWHADHEGNYDREGFRLRGHQYSDREGRYRLETIVPAQYPFRTRHIHVKVQAPREPMLTTQLYFPNEPRNRRDFLFDPRLLMAMQDADATRTARFDFILKLGS